MNQTNAIATCVSVALLAGAIGYVAGKNQERPQFPVIHFWPIHLTDGAEEYVLVFDTQTGSLVRKYNKTDQPESSGLGFLDQVFLEADVNLERIHQAQDRRLP